MPHLQIRCKLSVNFGWEFNKIKPLEWEIFKVINLINFLFINYASILKNPSIDKVYKLIDLWYYFIEI